ncbi:MAG: hypothetical protein ACREMJ_09470 [Gemmatimonadales bacterium]
MTFTGEATLWLYDEAQNRWESRATLPKGRGASGVGVVDGLLIVVGGMGPTGPHVDSTAKMLRPALLVQRRILLIRGHKVMLDADLAALYGVPTKRRGDAWRFGS